MDDYAISASAAVDLVADYVAQAREGRGPVTTQPDPDVLATELELDRWIRHGGMGHEELSRWLPRYLDATVRLHHPGSLAHQVAVPSTGPAVADLIHGATNNPMAKSEMGAVMFLGGLTGAAAGQGEKRRQCAKAHPADGGSR